MTRQSKLRRTKIVCTLGPVTSSPDKIKQLMLAGMDVARLNFSHGDHDTHRQTIHSVRGLSKELGKEVAILQDLGGPKIRIGELPVQELVLQPGERVVLSPTEDAADPTVIPVKYPRLVEDIAVGNRILLADGLVELKVEEKKTDRIVCQVLVGGIIQSHKGINLPSSSLRVAAFTEKDKEDLRVGLKEGVDFVALSFVRHEHDLEAVYEILRQREPHPLLIAKIETPQAIERYEKILDVVDCVMVARGDLGVEMSLEEVPMIQKKLIRMARQSAKPVITATQMLRSMVSSPRPTRAEATDVANAILDGTDALMLSEETAIGAYPVEAVAVLDKIARATEPYLEERGYLKEPASEHLPTTEGAITRSACLLSQHIQAGAIVAGTFSGSTARLVARFRPASPILGLTPHLHTLRQLALSWGVVPGLVDFFSDADEMFALASTWALEKGFAQQGDRLIVTAGIPVKVSGTTNLLKVIEL